MNDLISKNASSSVSLPCRCFKRGLGSLLGGLGVLAVLAGCQETRVVEVEVPVEMPKCELPAFDEWRKFDVDAWAIPDATFDVGEPLRLQMRVSTPSYMSIFYVSTSCKVTRLMHDRFMEPADIVDFPLAESGLEMTVKPPAGNEVFYFIATREKFNILSSSDILGQAAGITNIDLSPDQFYDRLRDVRGRINPNAWSMQTLYTKVVSHR